MPRPPRYGFARGKGDSRGCRPSGAACRCPDGMASASEPADAAALVEHLSAEAPVRVESKMRTVDEWKLIPGRDNHWWDCLVGAAVAASYSGVSAVGAEVAKQVRKVITREEMAARRAAIMGKMGR